MALERCECLRAEVTGSETLLQIDDTIGEILIVWFRAKRVNPADIKDMLLRWSRAKTRGYEGVSIDNFSGSWADGLAFCALIHHFFPDAFDFSTLSASDRRANFELAFKTIQEKIDVPPLITVNDMLAMGDKPDWKCLFTYLQSVYRKLYNRE